MQGLAFDLLYPRVGQAPISGGGVVIRDGQIVWVGPAREAPVPCQSLGGVALPGFIDSHVHLTATGLDYSAINAADYQSISQLLTAIKHKDLVSTGVVRVWGYDHDSYQEQRYPTLAELDAACPDNLLWINQIECHATLVNTKALNALGIISNHALLVGVDNSSARQFFMSRITQEERRQGIIAAAQEAVRKGLTCIHAMEGGQIFHNLDILAVRDLMPQLPVDIVLYPQVTDVDWVVSLGLDQIGGCLPLDGCSGVYTAALTGSYYESEEKGRLYFSQEEIFAFAEAAQAAGLQIALHACGDAAIDMALDAFAHAAKINPGYIGHRIEHFEIPRRDQVERCARLGVILSMQPAFDKYWGGPLGDYVRTLGPESWQNINPLGWVFAGGLTVAGGSDSSVTPMDPLLGIQAALSHHCPSQRLNIGQALMMFTEHAAQAGNTRTGCLLPGYRANITVLDSDPHTRPGETLTETGILATLVGGVLVWSK